MVCQFVLEFLVLDMMWKIVAGIWGGILVTRYDVEIWGGILVTRYHVEIWGGIFVGILVGIFVKNYRGYLCWGLIGCTVRPNL